MQRARGINFLGTIRKHFVEALQECRPAPRRPPPPLLLPPHLTCLPSASRGASLCRRRMHGAFMTDKGYKFRVWPPHSLLSLSPHPPARARSFNQHRCHARMTDAVEAVWSARGGGMERLSLFIACLRSDPGAEPTDPPTIHPADFYRLRLRGEPKK